MKDAEDIHDYVKDQLPGFGINKHQAIVRLLSDVSRRENVLYKDIIPRDILNSKDFSQVKFFLMKLRYPSIELDEFKNVPALSAMSVSHADRVHLPGKLCSPTKIYYERAVRDAPLIKTLRASLGQSEFEEIDRYRDHIKLKEFSISEYNLRSDTLFVVKENFDIFLDCPCSHLSRSCGYHILNAGMGCSFDCVYCYLQGYVNAPGLVIPGNLEEMLQKFSSYCRPGMRIGTGQFTDSLLLDHITGFSNTFIDFFQEHPDVTFEFKTKSNHVQNIITHAPSGNIVISWSMNPQSIIASSEYLTATLDERLQAARQCVDAGYKVGFHFDPIIFYDEWQKEYEEVVAKIFNAVNAGDIAWISLGCLRMTLKARQIMESRFPDSPLNLAELIVGFDGKLRYSRPIRKEIYREMISGIRKYSQDLLVYLCMEDEQMNLELNIPVFEGCAS